MDSNDIDFPTKKSPAPKGNPWLVSMKSLPIFILLWFYVLNYQSIVKFFGIDDFFISILILIVPSAIFCYVFRKKILQNILISNTYSKEFTTLFFLFAYVLYSLKGNFQINSQIYLTFFYAIFILYVWKNEILNKIRKKS